MSWKSDLTNVFGGVEKAIPPQVLRDYLRQQDAYVLYRRRTAAGLQQGLNAWDWYLKHRPTIFWSSLGVSAASAAAGWVRRKAGPEAWLIYALTGTVGAVAAFITRPTSPTATAVRESEEQAIAEGEEVPNPVFAYLDAKALQYDVEVPGFPDASFKRIVSLPGMKESYDSLPPLAQAAIV